MVGINPYKRYNSNHRFLCEAYQKSSATKIENLKRDKKLLGRFYGGIISTIDSEEETLGNSFKRENDTFFLETGDNVDELREGDYIFVRNMNTFFIITEKKTEVDSRSAEFSTYNRMNKLTTFRLRGLLWHQVKKENLLQ